MGAIVSIAGKQFNIKTDDVICVPKLNSEVDELVTFDKVLAADIKEQVMVGTPTLAKARVVAKVLAHLKADKVIVFKKKRRKGYKVKTGHRQEYTKVRIEKIITI